MSATRTDADSGAVLPTVEDLGRDGATGRRRVVIIGAGMAGLAAAYQLKKGAHEVVVLEARLRPGGRVHTVRAPFADGLHAEAGAMYIPLHHDYLMKYVSMFDLDLDPVPARDVSGFYFLKGQRLVHGEGARRTPWPLELRDDEHALGIKEMFERYFGRIERGIGDVLKPNWPPDELSRYDTMTVTELMEEQGASPAAADLLRISYFSAWGDQGRDMSALFAVRYMDFYSNDAPAPPPPAAGGHSDDGDGYWRIVRAGNDAVPRQLARLLAEEIYYGHAVRRIEQHESGLVVTAEGSRGTAHFRCDHVICAIPFPCLCKIEVDPPLSSAKQDAIETMALTPVAQAFVQVKRRVWAGGLASMGVTDLPLGRVRDATYAQPGKRGILNAYMTGSNATEMMARPVRQRESVLINHLEEVFPGITKEVEGVSWHDWSAEEWSLGGFVAFRAGMMLHQRWPHVARPEGQIHFAGDHTSYRPSWQDGAISSGHRAAREVHEA